MDLGLAGWVAVFVVAAAFVAGGGIVLARTGDVIADETGLGRLAVGLLLLSLATSLPEVATSISAAADGAADLAIGGYLGSNMANMAILAVVDLISRRRVFPLVELAQARVATGAIVLTALVGLAIVLADPRMLGPVGWDTVLVTATFGAILVWIRRAPVEIRGIGGPATASVASPILATAAPAWATDEAGPAASAGRDRRRLGRALLLFAVAAGVTVAAAPPLARSAEEIAALSGIGQTFVGVAFLAAATSMPELVASIAAVRIGAPDLAVGNLFGSNAFNMGVIITADVAYPGGPILAAVSPGQVLVAFGAIILTGLGLAAVLHGRETRVWHLEPDAVLILVCYALLLAATAGAIK
jgi:cation:H+ antiporter